MINQKQSLFSEVRALSTRYYNREMTFESYREQRNQLLDKINSKYNGITRPTSPSDQLFNF